MEEIHKIVIIAILIYLAYLSRFYLPAYFKKKGENLAQIQDIETLTIKVDSIKQDFIERTEYLKAKLDLTTQLQLGHYNEERNAIMSFLRAFANFYNMCVDSSLGGIDDYQIEELKKYRMNIDIAYNQLTVAKGILKVFVDDPELYQLYVKLGKQLLHLQLQVKHLLGELELNNKNIEQCRNNRENPNISQDHQNLLDERNSFFRAYIQQIEFLPDEFYSEINHFNLILKRNLVKSV